MNNKFGIFSTNDSIVIKVIVVCQYYITWNHYYQIRQKITLTLKFHSIITAARITSLFTDQEAQTTITTLLGDASPSHSQWVTLPMEQQPGQSVSTRDHSSRHSQGPACHTLHRLREGRPTRQAEETMHAHALLPYVRFHSQAFEGHTCRKVMYKMCTVPFSVFLLYRT